MISGFLTFSYEGHSDASLSPLLKGVDVTNRTENKKSHLALNESIAIYLRQNCRERQCHVNWHVRPQNDTAGEKTRTFLDEKFFTGSTVDVKPEKNIEVMCWRLSVF